MSLVIRERHGKDYYYFRKGAAKYLYLGPVDELSEIKQDRVLEALDYSKGIDSKNIELEYSLIKLLDPNKRDDVIFKRLNELQKIQEFQYVNLMSQAGQRRYTEIKIAELETRLRRLGQEKEVSPNIIEHYAEQFTKTLEKWKKNAEPEWKVSEASGKKKEYKLELLAYILDLPIGRVTVYASKEERIHRVLLETKGHISDSRKLKEIEVGVAMPEKNQVDRIRDTK